MCDQFQMLKSNPQFGFRFSACLNQSCESTLMTLPDFPSSFFLSHFVFFSLPLELRGGRTDPALPDWRGNHSHCSNHTDHLCLHHADLHSFPLGCLPPLSAFPHLLMSEWIRPHHSYAYWSSPRHTSASAWPQLRHCFPGHPFCWATSRKAAFPSCWTQTSMDWGVWSHFIPQCLLPKCGHYIPRLPGNWNVEP